jgi:hypothetical protein
MTFASRNLTLDAQSQQESHVKWTSLRIEPDAKSLKLFNPQFSPRYPVTIAMDDEGRTIKLLQIRGEGHRA